MRSSSEGETYLGIESGGTRTIAILATRDETLIERREFGPANLKLLDDAGLIARFREIAAHFPTPRGIGIGMAGARTEADWERIRRAASQVWSGVPVQATHDLEIALLAGAGPESSGVPAVLVLSGTGSCCYGRNASGMTAKMGGWGHILGDKGSGYEIGLRGLKAAVFYLDRDGEWGRLGQKLLRALVLNEPNELIPWVQAAPKQEVAALAPVVFEAAAAGDEIARDILEGAAHSLAKDALACAAKVAPGAAEVLFLLAGGVLARQAAFADQVARLLRGKRPAALVETLAKEGAWGAVNLAIQAGPAPARARSKNRSRPIYVPPLALEKSPTETRNPRSLELDRLPTSEAVRLMLKEEGRVIPALLRHERELAQAVDLIAAALQKAGRLFYAGAGTSGRLGVLDASECPPTFRADPGQVQGIIAGGQRALVHAVEGAEDDSEAGARAVEFRGICSKDVFVGIAASGRTPFVWGALAAARKRRARTILLTFNPSLLIVPEHRPDIVIAADLGPEVLTGSTRLKAGTATKLVLNLFSTLAMVRLGKVISNLMVDLNPSNTKLRDRAVRIVRELSGAGEEAARAALEQNGWVVKSACQRLARPSPPRAKAPPSKPSSRRSGKGRSGR